MAIDKIFDGAVDGIADNLFNSVSNSVSEIKAMQQRKAAENVQLVVQALKKIDADIREKYDGVTETIEKRVANIKDGRDGIDGKNGLDGVNGKDGRDGKDGRNGRDGLTGPRGFDGPKGADGKDGRDGEDGVSVTDAHIDFDGSLIISLSSGRVINVGEVVSADIAEKIKVITNGGGTSQPVLDQLASLQAQIDLISSALVYKGTWNASTNTPTLTSSVGTANTFYIVSVAGTTNLNGTSNWGVGDWAVYNGSVWQRIEGGAVGNFTDLSVSGTTTLSGLTASTALALNASKEIVSVTNTGSGNNVLATSPTLVTPVLGTPSSVTLTNATGLPLSTGVTGTLPIANGGTGQTTANTAFNALAPSQTGNSGKYLTTNGTSTSWATVASGTVTSVSGTGTVNGLTLTGTVTTSGSLTLGGTLSGISNASLTNSSITINGTATSLGGSISVGTVTSVAATVPSFLSITGSPITSSGTLAISLSGTALPTTSGGTGLTSFTANGVVYASSSSALTTGSALTFDGSKLVNTGYNKSTYQVSTNTVGTFESVGAAYLSYDSATGASIYSRSNATAENILNLRASTFSFKIGGTQVSSLDSSSFSLYNTPILLSGSTSGYTGFAAPATSNYTIYTLPSSDGTSGQSLVTNGSGTLSWASGTGGTVTSVSGTGTVSGISLSGTVTSSGNLTLGGALDLSAYGGAGAFTTLSASSTVTLSGGTANGVAYLNGSKVVTSGSALTFDGSILTNTSGAIRASGPSVPASGAGLELLYGASGAGISTLLSYDRGASAYKPMWLDGSYQAYFVSGSEAMRLTSTGLGIGTSSPAAKLDVTGTFNGTQAVFGYTSGRGLLIGTALNGGVNEGSTVLNARGAGNGQFLFQTDGTTRVTISDSGNLGLGVTPSAWVSPALPAFDIGTFGAIAGQTNAANLHFVANAYLGSGPAWKYKATNYASRFTAGNDSGTGGFSWFTAPSGTAGNAITFTQAMTLNASGNLGIGTTSPTGRIHAQIASTASTKTELLKLTDGALCDFKLYLDRQTTLGNSISRINTSSGNMAFETSDTERARIDSSGNLLVGTTSGSGARIKLQVAAAGTALHATDGTNGDFFVDFPSTQVTRLTAEYGSNGIMVFANGTSKTERARIDSSGNFGIGVTPSSWGSGYKAIQLLTSSLYGTTSRDMNLGANVYVDAVGYKYIQTSFATNYTQYQGVHSWYNAPSGTAGNAITFTQAMTLDASGNLGVGTTSIPTVGSTQVLAVGNSNGGTLGIVQSGSIVYRISASTTGVDFYTGNAVPVIFYTSGSERARIDSSGNLLVGGTSALQSAKITSYGSVSAQNGGVDGTFANAFVGVYSSNSNEHNAIQTAVSSAGTGSGFRFRASLGGGSSSTYPVLDLTRTQTIFYTDNTERARIDSSGNLLVGTTGGSGAWKLYAVSGATQSACLFENPATSGQTVGKFTRTASDGTAISFSRGGSDVGTISITTTATAYNTSSDYRLKENIQDAESASTLIDSLQVRQFDWKADGSHQRYGFVAQELVTVAPEAVHQPEDTDEMMAVDYSKLVPMLVKEIQSLRKRLADAGL